MQVPLELSDEPEAGLKGAALLAAAGVGLIGDPAARGPAASEAIVHDYTGSSRIRPLSGRTGGIHSRVRAHARLLEQWLITDLQMTGGPTDSESLACRPPAVRQSISVPADRLWIEATGEECSSLHVDREEPRLGLLTFLELNAQLHGLTGQGGE